MTTVLQPVRSSAASWRLGSMRHMSRSRPTLTHIFPPTMKTIPPNILFSSTWTVRPRAALTRPTRAFSGATAVSPLALLRIGRGVEVDVERCDLAGSHSKHLGHVAPKALPAGRLQVIVRQGARPLSVDDQLLDLHCRDHRVSALGRLAVGRSAADSLDRAREARERHVVSQKRLPILLQLEAAEVGLERLSGCHMSSFLVTWGHGPSNNEALQESEQLRPALLMAAHSGHVREAFVGPDHLGQVLAGVPEFDGNQRLADAPPGLLPVPGEHQAHRPIDVAVDADRRMRLALGVGHGEPVAPADSEVDRRASERPPL